MTTRSVQNPTKWRPSGARTPLHWLSQSPPQARKALLAASLGWALDSFDVMLYSLVLTSIILELHLTKATAGILGSITLLAAAAGGLFFGVIADRFGRTRALMASVLMYAVFTAACGFAHTVVQLAIFRILLGFGMGGEWASGAALVSESFPEATRGKALALMQSSWAIGYGLAALVVAIVLPHFGWRAVFFVGVLPAFFTLWIRRNVQETLVLPQALPSAEAAKLVPADPPHLSFRSEAEESAFVSAPTITPTFRTLFQGKLLPLTLGLTLMNACCLFGWWGFNLWVPAYLSLPVNKGGIGLTGPRMTAIVVFMQVGMWFGYVTFGYIADRFGRTRVYAAYLIAAAILMLFFGATRSPIALFLLAPLAAFAATGYFSGFAAITASVFESRIRATGQGFSYNTGRIASAAAPFLAGSLADKHGFSAAFMLSAVAFLLAALLIWALRKRLAVTQPGN